MRERQALVQQVGAVKGDRAAGALALRPAREALILRRLLAQAGQLPSAMVVAIWRELLAAGSRAQTPFAVAVWAPERHAGVWEIAREHFGSSTPLLPVEGAAQALRLLEAPAGDGTARLAVLPLPDETDLWWQGLLAASAPDLRICARLPFCPRAGRSAGAVVVANLPLEPSGDDLTVLALETTLDLSRGRLVDALTRGGLAPRWVVTARSAGSDHARHLLEIEGFVAGPSPELGRALEPVRAQVEQCAVVGAYARPAEVRP